MIWQICPGAPAYRNASGSEQIDRKSPAELGDMVSLHLPGPSPVVVEICSLPDTAGIYGGAVLSVTSDATVRGGVVVGSIVKFKWRHVFAVTRAKG